MGLIGFAIKTTIVGGVVYYTYHEGLWSKSEDTAKLYKKIYTNIAPYVKDNVPKDVIQEISQLPSMNDVSNLGKISWNKGVMVSMEFLANLPTHATNGANNVSEIVQKYMNELMGQKN